MILFLDFDGVLNIPGQYGTRMFDETCLQNLYSLFDRNPNLRVVFSTSWREIPSWSFDRLRDLFDEKYQDRFIGRTPVIKDPRREEEVQAWNEAHLLEGWCPWVAVDDCAGLFKHTSKVNLVITDFREGLTEAKRQEIEDKLNAQ